MYKIRQQPTLYPEGQAIIVEKQQKKKRKQHLKALRYQTASIDAECPRSFPKRLRNPYKVISHIRDVNSENRNFMNRLLTIPSDDNVSAFRKPHNVKSLNGRKRQKKLKSIDRENRKMAERLKTVGSVLDHKKFKPKHRSDVLKLRQNTRSIWTNKSGRKLKKAYSAGNILVKNDVTSSGYILVKKDVTSLSNSELKMKLLYLRYNQKNQRKRH